MEIFKDRLPKGLSYALKPSVLGEALAFAEVKTPARLYQWRENKYHRNGTIFSAYFRALGVFIHDETDVLAITSLALPSHHRHEARQFVETVILPEFILWITDIERLPLNSPMRHERQEFERVWQPPAVEEATFPGY